MAQTLLGEEFIQESEESLVNFERDSISLYNIGGWSSTLRFGGCYYALARVHTCPGCRCRGVPGSTRARSRYQR